jgi:uncharacterized membrane protein
LTSSKLNPNEPKLETIISYLLIIGVVVSVILEVIGMVLFFGNYGNVEVSQNPSFYISGENFFVFVGHQFQRLFVSENAIIFMILGLIVLIFTPYIRASTSVVYFAWEKNYKYVFITLFVLIVLTVSLALH